MESIASSKKMDRSYSSHGQELPKFCFQMENYTPDPEVNPLASMDELAIIKILIKSIKVVYLFKKINEKHILRPIKNIF